MRQCSGDGGRLSASACHVFVCVVYVFRAGAKREVVRCAFRSFVRNVFLRGSWCSDYGGTMGGRDVPIISAFPVKYADLVRGVSRRVIPVPGMLGRNWHEHRFAAWWVFKAEFLEICEFVWPNRIFLQVFLLFPFDPCGQIAKRI